MCFCVSCLAYKQSKLRHVVSEFNDDMYKKELNKYLIITLSIASLGILSSIYNIISIYGTNLIYNITNVYAARVNEDMDFQVIPYVGSFLYISLPLAGIYVKRYGVSIWVMYAFALVALNSLTSGARAGIVFSLLLFVYGYIVCSSDHTIKKRNGRSNMGLYVGALILLFFFIFISQKRAAGNELPYATDMFYKYFGGNVMLYKTFAYIANPIGVLNEYLQECNFFFGKNTLLPVYNILAKFGLMGRIEQYQGWYNIPAPCNVGTWLRELSEDFTWVGALVFISIFAYITSKEFMKSLKTHSTSSIVVTSILLMIVTLSFFDWKLRTSGIWIALAFGFLIGNKIDKSLRNNGRHIDIKLQ